MWQDRQHHNKVIVFLFELTNTLWEEVKNCHGSWMDGSIARGQIRNQRYYYVIGHRNESIAKKRNHVAECLKGMQIHFAVSVCESRTEDIKYLFV